MSKRVGIAVLSVFCAAALSLEAGGAGKFQLEYASCPDLSARFGHAPHRDLHLAESPAEELSAEPFYFSRSPQYTALRLGTGGDTIFTLALDESRGTGTGYDTLFVDTNNNNDLTDDGELIGKSAGPSGGIEFPLVKLSVPCGPERFPYHIRFRLTEDLRAYSAGFCRGSVTFGEEKATVWLLDETLNGLFDDRYTLKRDRRRGPEVVAGDTVLIGIDGPTRKQEAGERRALPGRCLLGSILPFTGGSYEVDVAPHGRRLEVRESSGKCGSITAKTGQGVAHLLGEKGVVSLRGAGTFQVPPGTYQFVSCSFLARDGENRPWLIVDRGQWRNLAVQVKAGEKSELRYGPPLVAEIYVTPLLSDWFRFDLAMRGQGNESLSGRDFRQAGKETDPPPPGFKICRGDGTVVAAGQFKYG